MKYSAFISYRRQDAGVAARWLRKRLLAFRPPHDLLCQLPAEQRVIAEAPRAYFLDTSYQSANEDFWKAIIEPALHDSEYLIVLSSPSAFGTRNDGSANWVTREIDTFLKLRGEDEGRRRILLVLSRGAQEDAFPGRLSGLSRQWDWADLRRLSRLSFLRPGAAERLDDAFLKIVARLFDVPQELLPILRREEARRRGRLRMAAAGAVFSVILGLSAALGWAIIERQNAQRERDRALTQLLAMQASRATAEADTPDRTERAAALALESINIARRANRPLEADAIEAGRTALTRLPLQAFSQGSPVASLAVLKDGRLASGGDDGQIRLWPRDGVGESVILWHDHRVSEPAGAPSMPVHRTSALVVLTDGRLVSGGYDGQIKVWRQDGVGEPVVLSHGSAVTSLAALPDGRLASGGIDGQIKLWPRDGVGEPLILRHGRDVRSLVLLHDGGLASGGDNGNIKVWPRDGVGEPVVLRHGDRVLSLMVLADGRLASGGIDGQIKLWPRDGVGEPVILSHGSAVTSLAALPDGRLASGGGTDGQIKVWPQDGEGDPLLLSHGSAVTVLAALPDGRLATGGIDGKIKVWPRGGADEPVILRHGRKWVSSLVALTDGRLASGGLDDGQIKIWPRDGVGEPVVLRHGDGVLSLAELAGGGLASGGIDGRIKLWRRDGTNEPVTFRHDNIWSLVRLADGRLASGGLDGQIKLWPRDGVGEPVVLPNGSPVTSLAALPDGRLASGDGTDGQIKLWPRGGGDPVILLHGSAVAVRSLVVLADGRLATGGTDGQIKLWPRDGRGEPAVLWHGRPVWSLAVLADGRLASGGEDGQIKLWPRDGVGEPVILSHGSAVTVRSLVVLADGRLASGGWDGQIKLWLVDEEKLISALCLRAGRNLRKDEWLRYIGSDTPRQPSCRYLPSNWRTLDP